MWFLNSFPDSVHFKAFVESFGKGYQHSSLQFRVEFQSSEKTEHSNAEDKTENNSYFLVMPFPWSADKANGSFKVVKDDRLDRILAAVGDDSLVTRLNESEIGVYKNVKELKKSNNQCLIDFPTIKEIWNVYVEEDFGVFVVEIQPGVNYRIDYTHKISCLSSLFVQTRYSNLHQMKTTNFTSDVWVSGARRTALPDHIKSLEYPDLDMNIPSLDRYTTENYDEDLRFPTNCWESSDEEFEEGENNTETTPIVQENEDNENNDEQKDGENFDPDVPM
jgi:hypothetical protein